MQGLLALPWLRRAVIRDVLALEGVDRRCDALAVAQEGALSGAQAQLLGASVDEIRGRRESGRWRVLHPGVYRVGHVTARGRAIGALLACPAKTPPTHLTSAWAWDVIDDYGDKPHVTLPSKRSSRTLHCHTSLSLNAKEVQLRHGLPVSRPDRMIIECADVLPRHELARLMREARVKGLVTADSLIACCAAHPGRHGVKAVRAILAAPDGAPSKSWGERRLLELIAEAGLPRPECNAVYGGRERDLLWREQGVVGEIDDWNTHGDPATFEADHARDTDLALLGARTVRLTTLQIKHEPIKAVAALAAALASRA